MTGQVTWDDPYIRAQSYFQPAAWIQPVTKPLRSLCDLVMGVIKWLFPCLFRSATKPTDDSTITKAPLHPDAHEGSSLNLEIPKRMPVALVSDSKVNLILKIYNESQNLTMNDDELAGLIISHSESLNLSDTQFDQLIIAIRAEQ